MKSSELAVIATEIIKANEDANLYGAGWLKITPDSQFVRIDPKVISVTALDAAPPQKKGRAMPEREYQALLSEILYWSHNSRSREVLFGILASFNIRPVAGE